MVEGEAVIDNVVRPHAESIVHQGSHTVIPLRVQGKEVSATLEGRGRLPNPEEATSILGTCLLPAVYHDGCFG